MNEEGFCFGLGLFFGILFSFLWLYNLNPTMVDDNLIIQDIDQWNDNNLQVCTFTFHVNGMDFAIKDSCSAYDIGDTVFTKVNYEK